MQRLNTLWQAVNVVSEVQSLLRHTQTYNFLTPGPSTLYLRADSAEVRVMRWALPKIEVTLTLQAPFLWRVAAEQDEAGVYVVARQRRVVGEVTSAVFTVTAPLDTYLLLALDKGRVVMEQVSGTLTLPPLGDDATIRLLPPGATE